MCQRAKATRAEATGSAGNLQRTAVKLHAQARRAIDFQGLGHPWVGRADAKPQFSGHFDFPCRGLGVLDEPGARMSSFVQHTFQFATAAGFLDFTQLLA